MGGKVNLELLEKHLKKRLNYPYSWGRKQSDDWDRQTYFIYSTRSFSDLLKEIDKFNEELRNYALNRWLNFWSAVGVECIFGKHNQVTPNINQYDKLVDFSINRISFDHKTSVFPKGFGKSLEYALENKKELITWFYENQSQQGRKHHKNRLFIVLYDTQHIQDHWKMKTEISLLKQKIDEYVVNFKSENLTELDFGQGKIFSDIIWVIK